MTEEGDPPLGNPVTPDVHAMTTGSGLGSVTLDPNLITTDTGVLADMNTAGTAPGHSIGPPIAAHHAIGAPACTATTETFPTTDHLLTAISPKMIADLDIAPDTANTNQPKDHQQQHRHHLRNMKIGNKNINKSPLTIHPQNITAQMKVKLTLRMI